MASAKTSTVCISWMFICVYDVTYFEAIYSFNIWQLHKFMRNAQKNYENCVKSSFSIKVTKIAKENQGWNILYIRGYDVTNTRFKTLELHDCVRTDQNTTKLCTRLFIHKFIKGYLRYKTIFCHKVALDVELVNFFIWSKNNVSFTRYLNFCVFVKSTHFKICDVIINIAT